MSISSMDDLIELIVDEPETRKKRGPEEENDDLIELMVTEDDEPDLPDGPDEPPGPSVFRDTEGLDDLPSADHLPPEIRRQIEIEKLASAVYNTFPPLKKNSTELDNMLYHFFYFVQYIVRMDQLGGKNDSTLFLLTDNDLVIAHKAHLYALRVMFEKFQAVIHLFAKDKYEKTLAKMPEGNPTREWFSMLPKYKEMHVRRIKTDLSAGKTKNSVTHETFDPANPNHKSWRWIIFNPLPSDFDTDALDPEEDVASYVNLEADRLRGTSNVPEPFCVIVTMEFANLFKTMHVLLHFHDYVNHYLLECIDPDFVEHQGRKMSWQHYWRHLVGDDFADKGIEDFGREKRKMPEMVTRIATLRDFLKDADRFNV